MECKRSWKGKTRYKKDAQNNGRSAREKRGLTFDFPLSSFHSVFSSIHVSCPFHTSSTFSSNVSFHVPFMFSLISLHVIFMFLQIVLSCFLRVSLENPIWKMKSRHPKVAIFVHSCRRFKLTLEINDATKMPGKQLALLAPPRLIVFFQTIKEQQKNTKKHLISCCFLLFIFTSLSCSCHFLSYPCVFLLFLLFPRIFLLVPNMFLYFAYIKFSVFYSLSPRWLCRRQISKHFLYSLFGARKLDG